MDTFQAIILGLVQGLTEFLPISSSGHLILVPWLFNWNEPGLAFDAALHLGTLVAVFAYFWRDLLAMILAIPTALSRPRSLLFGVMNTGDSSDVIQTENAPDQADRHARLALLLIVGSIPGGILGLVLQNKIDDFFHA